MKYTPAFQAVCNELQALSEKSDISPEEFTKIFRQKMRDVGWLERIQNLYKVRDKLSGKFKRFRPNKSQLKFLKGKTHKEIILKCRQVGFTTVSCVYALDRALFDSWNTGIMSHKKELVVKIFDIIKNSYEYFVKEWGEFYQAQEEQNNTTRLSWKDTKSSITVAYDFQGLTVKFLHVSEAAFVPGQRLTNSLQAVPDTGEVILESTPDGRGGFFYDVWQDWRQNGDGSPYHGFFIPWFEHYPEDIEKYTPSGPIKWTDEELALKEQYDLQDYHLFWRRDKIRGDCHNDAEEFEKHYPSDDVSCFLAGSSNVFKSNTLHYQEKFVQEPSHIGFLKLDGKKVKLIENPKENLKIFRLPQVGKSYSIGVDTSSGMGKDPSVIQVLDAQSGEQVAEYVGFLEPDALADEIYKIAQFYHQAWVCIEANNHGSAVILSLKPRYFNLYRRQEFDSIKKRISNQIGFYSSSSTKLTVTDNIVAALRDGRIKVHSNALLSEMSTFENVIRKSNDGRMLQTNKREARPGCYDDRVMALALAYEMLRSRPGTDDDSDKHIQREIGIPDPDTGFLSSNELLDNDLSF